MKTLLGCETCIYSYLAIDRAGYYCKQPDYKKIECVKTKLAHYVAQLEINKPSDTSSDSYATHAEWQTFSNEEDSGFVHCSKCHAEFRIDDLECVGDDKGFVNYCPACGTRMINHD